MSGAFAVCTSQWYGSSVHLDSGDDVMLSKHFHHGLSIAGLLGDGVMEQNDAADVLLEVGTAREQKLTERKAILLDVFNVELRQTFAE